MARKRYGYVEPADFFPPEIRKKIDADLAAKAAKEKEAEKPQKSDPYKDQNKRLIEEERKKKAAKK